MRKVLSALVLLLAMQTISSQNESVIQLNTLERKFAIAFVPQYAIVSGMRLDFDIKVAPNQYVTVAPQMYYNSNYKMYYREPVDMRGVGVNLNYRYIFNNTVNAEGPYLGLGLAYKYYDVSYWGTQWVNYIENGNTFQRQEDATINKYFNQAGYDLLFGYQTNWERLFLDFYIGWGFRLSDFKSEGSNPDKWGETIFDPGYSGFLPTAGFRLGIYLQ